MEIPYLKRSSRFLTACESAIREHRAQLHSGGLLRVDLKEGGYNARVMVTVDPSDRIVFRTNWDRPDPTRFPARIKAAATALLNCSCGGRFEISHSDGSLAIRAL